ncbi:MAG: class II fructose-bisphosphate aldolase [Bacteroidales bacterium]|nr:class II fructose-bisphosphate aldolase [Bacteroidales bacterium]
MTTTFQEILQDAYEKHYAVGAFNILSLEHLQGTIKAAEELSSPVIIQLAEVQFPYCPIDLMAPLYIAAAKRAKVPVCVHLDHGNSIETCAKAIGLGFDSVMFDGAQLPFPENIAATSKVVELAKKNKVAVEAELGKVGLTEDTANISHPHDDVFTDPDEAAEFIEHTGTDALAISIGNLHGKYIATPQLNIRRLQEISSKAGIPLVLHGGSGTSAEDFKACIHNGISKINVATALQLAVADALTAQFGNGKTDFFKAKEIMAEATYDCVKNHILLFESNGKA